MADKNDQTARLSEVEHIKKRSRGLRGTIAADMANQLTGELSEENKQLLKFHGAYQQDDRDRRLDREAKKLEWAYSFMIRLRIPGGRITAEQWIGLQDSCDRYANGIIKITTRQTVQFHGVVKSRMKPTMKDFDALGLDTIAACGDVNRNVMAGCNPLTAPWQEEAHAYAHTLGQALLPKTGAMKEIWLDGEKLAADQPAEDDPLYRETYLPRKFKIAIAIPPHNETDVFAHDIGLIAIGDGEKFEGFNVVIGGGLGMSHGNPDTYPRVGTPIGFIPKDKTEETCWHIVAVQRNYGNREDRKRARFKYTIDRLGVDFIKTEIEKRQGFAFEALRPYELEERGDPFGWVQNHAGRWFYTMFVENGVVRDEDNYAIKAALYELARTGKCGFNFTANQNIMLTGIADKDKAQIDDILQKHGIEKQKFSPVRKDAMACVALPTCPLALTEAQRYMPELLGKVEKLLAKNDLEGEPITMRMTGCPNGCARPYLAEVGLVGKAAGRYVLRLGGDALGHRLNQIYLEEADEGRILETLDELFALFKKERKNGETFGDYIFRTRFDSELFDPQRQTAGSAS